MYLVNIHFVCLDLQLYLAQTIILKYLHCPQEGDHYKVLQTDIINVEQAKVFDNGLI